MHPSFIVDESFSFGLIDHNLVSILHLDAMDVHPPLYYLLLKSFIYICTFWTKSVFIQVIFGRIFSVISFILFVLYISKVLKQVNCIHNYLFQWVLFLLVPSVMLNVTKIRMYSLSSLFLVIEFYELLLFYNRHKNIYLVIATVFTILNLYTFYFAGLSAGIFMIEFGIIFIISKKWKSFYKILLSSIICIIAYIPWLPILLSQIKYHTTTDTSGNSGLLYKILSGFTQIEAPTFFEYLIGFFILIVFIMIIIFSINYINKYFNSILLCVLINIFITFIISLILCSNHFQSVALYPIYTIFLSLITYSASICICKNKKFIFNKIILLLILLLSLLSIKHIKTNVVTYDVPSIYLEQNFNNWGKSARRNIITNSGKYPISKEMTASEDAVYLKSINKKAILNNCSYKKFAAGLVNDNKNTSLVKGTFNNLSIRNK